MEHDVPLCFCGKGVGSTCLQCCDVSLSSFLVTLKNVLQLRSIRKIVLQPMMHAEKDSSRKLAFFLSLRLFNFEALLESFVNHVYSVKALMEMSIHLLFWHFWHFTFFTLMNFPRTEYWTDGMASKMRESVAINKIIGKLEWMMVYNFQLKFEISFYW